MLCRKCLYDQAPIKSLDAESPMSFPDRQHFTGVTTVQCRMNLAHPV